MTPEEKAKELVDTMSKQTYSFQEYAGARYSTEEVGYEAGKKCAIIAVDEILNTITKDITLIHFTSCHDPKCPCGEFWEQVKQAIIEL